MLEGMEDRIKIEMMQKVPKGKNIKVVASEDRKHAVWKGASTLAFLSTFSSCWVSRDEY